MAIDKDKLLSAIEAKEEYAYGAETDSEIARARQKVIEAYFGLNTNPAPEGRSQIVDRSVYETISVMLPALVRIFSGSSDEVCKFTPVGPEDEAGAEQTTAYINHVATQKNPWEQICTDLIFEALMFPNAYVMPYYDQEEGAERETYEGQTDDQIAALLQDPKVRVVGHSEKQHPELGIVHDVEIERSYGGGCVRIQVLPSENVKVDGNTPNWTLKQCKYFEYSEEKTVAELQAMLKPYGVNVPLDIGGDEDIDDRPESIARDRFGETGEVDEGKGLLRRVVVGMGWVESDAEGDDARLYYFVRVAKTVLHAEAASRIGVASLCASPMPHRHPGVSIAETVIDIQEIQTAITRGALDNLYLANNGRYAISDKVNLDDFLDSRPGGAVRLFDGAMPGEGHIFPLTHPFAFEQIVGAKEYFDQIRQNRSGASRYFSGTDAGAINKTASGTMALQGMAAQRIEHIARMLAPGFEELFSLVLELVSKHQNKAEVIKLRGQWVPVDPQAWMTKRDVRISVGVGAGNKDAMLAQLSMTMQEQMVLAQAGIVRPENLYETAIEKMKLQGFSNPEKFFTDPRQNPPQPQGIPPEEAQKMAEQVQKLGQENAQLKITNGLKDIEIKKKELETQAKDLEMGLREKALDVGKREVGLTQQATQMSVDQVNGDAERKAQEEEVMKQELAQLIQAIVQTQTQNMQQMAQVTEVMAQAAQAMTQVAQAMATPKRRVVERDPQTNRVVGMVEEPVTVQ